MEDIARGEFKLYKPVMIDGKEVAVLNYDFDNLTGNDMQETMKELLREKYTVQFAATDQVYNSRMFIRACGLNPHDVCLNAKDLSRGANLAIAFFNTAVDDSESDT